MSEKTSLAEVVTVSVLKQLMDELGISPQKLPDKNYGWIVLIMRNGFVFVGDTRRIDGVGYLKGYQVRYWSQRDDGLPEFAAKGSIKDDKLDSIEGELEFPWSNENVIGVLPCGSKWKK